MPKRKTLAAVLVPVLLVGACSSGSTTTTTTTTAAPPSTTATTTTTAPPTTTVTTSTTAPPTTTSTEPPELTTATGALPRELLDRIGELYSWLGDRRNPEPAISAGMLDGLSSVSRHHRPIVGALGTIDEVVRDLGEGDVTHQVGVVRVGDDTLIVSDDGAWEIVGFVSDDVAWLGGPLHILVLGSDARPGENQLRLRADSIHIVSFDTDNLRGTILGFPRDSYVEGPIRGFDKFAHHLAAAGPDVMLEVAENRTQLDLDGYAVTGFVGFQGLIGELGGLLIDLPRSVNTGNNWQNFASGLQRLSPLRTLQLARARKGVPGGDFGRSANQGLIMLAIIDMVQPLGLEAMPSFAGVFFDHAWSDVPTDRLAQFAAAVFLVDTDDLQNVVLPGTVQTIRGSSVVVLDDIVDDVFVDLEDGWLDTVDW